VREHAEEFFLEEIRRNSRFSDRPEHIRTELLRSPMDERKMNSPAITSLVEACIQALDHAFDMATDGPRHQEWIKENHDLLTKVGRLSGREGVTETSNRDINVSMEMWRDYRKRIEQGTPSLLLHYVVIAWWKTSGRSAEKAAARRSLSRGLGCGGVMAITAVLLGLLTVTSVVL